MPWINSWKMLAFDCYEYAVEKSENWQYGALSEEKDTYEVKVKSQWVTKAPLSEVVCWLSSSDCETLIYAEWLDNSDGAMCDSSADDCINVLTSSASITMKGFASVCRDVTCCLCSASFLITRPCQPTNVHTHSCQTGRLTCSSNPNKNVLHHIKRTFLLTITKWYWKW